MTKGNEIRDVVDGAHKIEEYHERSLKEYLEFGKKGEAHGVSHVQHVCRIGYNQAYNTITYGIEKGVLVRDTDNEWLHRIVPKCKGSGEVKG